MTDWSWIRPAPAVLAVLVSLNVLGSVSGRSSEVVSARGSGQDEETLEWLDDYDEAFALAKKTGQPVLLEFRCAP